MKAFAELSEDGRAIEVHFPYDPNAIYAIKAVPGRKFVPKQDGGPKWRVPLDLTSARRLREEFGDNLTLGEALKAWGRDRVANERNLRSLSIADDWPLKDLEITSKLPELAQWFRPYQRADVKYLASTNALNCNEQGLGKTTEIIAAVFEAGLEDGPHLVVAPKTSLETVWLMELRRWTDHKVFVYSGDVPKTAREKIYEDVAECMEKGEPFWFVTTADTIRRGNDPDVEWNSFTIDEFHKTGLSEPKNKFPQNANRIKCKRRFAVSGTPMGGKPIKLWGGLHFLDPVEFSSKWRWAEQWLVIRDNGFGKEILGIQPGREDLFFQVHAQWLLRRLKSEVLPQLPPKQYVDVWCTMTPKQKRQYEDFARDAEIKINDEHLSATSILAEFTRLKQFANSMCTLEEGRVLPTTESGKLPYLLERLQEVGIDPDDPSGDAQAVIASQFKGMANMTADWLESLGIPCARITGDTKGKDRLSIVESFQNGDGPRVVVMTTTAGGVSITLDKADTVHILDETWNPDDQEQLADRIHRASRIHQVTVYTYRSTGTLEESIFEMVIGKGLTNKQVLDLSRNLYKKSATAAE